MSNVLFTAWDYFSNLTNLIGIIFLLLSFKPKKSPMDKSNYFNYWIALWLTATRPDQWAKVYKYFRMDEMDKINAVEKSPVKVSDKSVNPQTLTMWATFVTSVLIPTTNAVMDWFGKLSSRTQKIIVILTGIGTSLLTTWYIYFKVLSS